jgi:SGT1 protein
LETVPVRFTRLQYAKLAYLNFHIPKKFHGASRIIGGTESRKMTQSFDMGCRLMCGFEAMYQREKSETASNTKSRMKNQNEVNLKNNIESTVYYSSKHKKEYNLCTVIDSILENTNTDHLGATKGKKNINDSNESSVEMKKSRDLLEAFKRICNETPEDSDSWMYLSPEELDLEMETRVKKIQKENINSASATDKASNITIPPATSIEKGHEKNSANDKKKNENKNSEENPSSDQLMKMLEGMKAFLGTKSGPEGIEDAIKSVTKSKTVKSNIAKNTENFVDTNAKNLSENGNVVRVKECEVIAPNNNNNTENNRINTDNNDDDDEPLEFDFDKLQDILQNFGENEKSNTHQNVNENESSKIKNHPPNLSSDPSKNPLGDYFYEKDLEEFSSDDDSDYDSDDEVDHSIVSSRVEEKQFNEHNKGSEENLKIQEQVEIISQEAKNNYLGDDFQLSIIGMKNIKIDIKTLSESNSHSSFNFNSNAKLNSSSRGNEVHDGIRGEKSNYNNDDNDANDDDTDSFYDDSDTDSDDEIDSRQISDRKCRSSAASHTDNSGGKMNKINDRDQGSDGGVEEEGKGEGEGKGEEGFEGRYFEEYEVRSTIALSSAYPSSHITVTVTNLSLRHS